MIVGRFGDTTGRPYVGARLLLPRFNVTANLSFLVDTGADRSMLMPVDIIRMGIDRGILEKQIDVGGVGGSTVGFREKAVLAFAGQRHRSSIFYSIEILIAQDDRNLMRTPSLLGRDVLDRWKISYDPHNNELSFTVRSADLIDTDNDVNSN